MFLTNPCSLSLDVQRNVRAVRTQIEDTENKLNSLLIVSMPGAHNEDGLPVAEIREDLDEYGNIIGATFRRLLILWSELTICLASSISHPIDAQTHIARAFEEATLAIPAADDFGKLARPHSKPGQIKNDPLEARITSEDLIAGADKNALVDPTTRSINDEKGEQGRQEAPSDHNASQKSHPNQAMPNPTTPTVTPSRITEEHATWPNKKGSRFIELDDADQEILSVPTNILQDSAEEATLRREMLEYSLSEVGSVVAELNLDQEGDWSSYSEDDPDSDSQGGEDEDQYGRSTSRILTDQYVAEMLNLGRKLDAAQNDGPGAPGDAETLTRLSRDARLLVIQDPNASRSNNEKHRNQGSTKKSVRFAEQLDVSPPKPNGPAYEEGSVSNRPDTQVTGSPLATEIIERHMSTTTATRIRKQGLNSSSSPQPAVQKHDILQPRSQDDTELLKEENSLDEEEYSYGRTKKISKFKAARLGAALR